MGAVDSPSRMETISVRIPEDADHESCRLREDARTILTRSGDSTCFTNITISSRLTNPWKPDENISPGFGGRIVGLDPFH
jgi:hypothetical protein